MNDLIKVITRSSNIKSISSNHKRNYQRRLRDQLLFFFYNLADISRQEASGASDRALNEPNS